MSWKIAGVSCDEEEFFATVPSEYCPPFVFIVFGADTQRKDDVYRIFRGRVGNPLSFDHKSIDGYVGQVRMQIRRGRPVLICAPGQQSSQVQDRVALIDRLRKLGAKSVIGVYVEAALQDQISFKAVDLCELTLEQYYAQIDRLIEEPPIENAYDLMVTVDGE